MTISLHPTAEKQLARLGATLPQSFLITGPKGIGLHTIAKHLAGTNIAAVIQPNDTKGEIDENGTINVEMIRQLYTQTRAKHTNRQVIIIDDADHMSAGAQAAFLKLLEEPNEHIYFILTSHSHQKLLPTIRSRVQQLQIDPITTEQTTKHLQQLGVTDPVKQRQLQFIAAGLPAELTRLSRDDDYFAKRAKIVTDARTFLQATPYDKLLIVQRYQSDRSTAVQLIDSAMQILRFSLSDKPQQVFIKQLDMLLDIRECIMHQYNIRLQLARFVV